MTAATLTLVPDGGKAKDERTTRAPHVATDAGTLAAAPPDEDRLDREAAVLSVTCALHLRAIAHRGGPGVDEHVEELRRLLVRRDGRRAGLARRRQIRHAVAAAASGRPGAILPGDRRSLVRDLRELERALAPAARVGVRTAEAVQNP